AIPSPGAMDPNAPPREFQTIQAGSAQIRTLPIGLYDLAPSYALTPDMLIFSINLGSVKTALSRLSGASPSLTSGGGYADLTRTAGTNKLYSYTQTDI